MWDFFVGVGKFLWVLFQVILLFNLLIVVHELGHYWAAKWRGLKVEKFQIWFGKPIWKKEIGGVQWGLGTIPMGGFVALPQMAPMEVLEGSTKTRDLPPIKPLDKIIVAFAGPLFSLLLAFTFALLVWGLGKPVSDSHETTVVGAVLPDMPAAEAGLLAGDRILEVNDYPVRNFVGMVDSVIERVIYSKGEKIKLLVQRPGVEAPVEIFTGYHKEERPAHKRQDFRKIGAVPAAPAIVGATLKGSPAAQAGLKPGDRIIAANGEELLSGTALRFISENSMNVPIELTVLRGGKEIQVSITPRVPSSPAGSPPMLGIRWGSDVRVERPGPNPFVQVWDGGTAIFRTIGALFASDNDVSVNQMSSAVGIGNYYYQSLSDPVNGWRLALVLSVLINVNLALLNLLPFPVLDGGHITMATYEWIMRKPMNFRFMEYFQAACALLLIGFMLFVTWFDVGDLVDNEESEPIVFDSGS